MAGLIIHAGHGDIAEERLAAGERAILSVPPCVGRRLELGLGAIKAYALALCDPRFAIQENVVGVLCD